MTFTVWFTVCAVVALVVVVTCALGYLLDRTA